jgi:hypothetical protein
MVPLKSNDLFEDSTNLELLTNDDTVELLSEKGVDLMNSHDSNRSFWNFVFIIEQSSKIVLYQLF